MNPNRDKNDKQYCCSNPSCLYVFSEPLEIKQYACPQCKKLIDIDSKKPEPEELTLQQRLEAMVEKKHKDEEKAKEPPSSSPECLHYFGYLHQREVGQAMPEECVVCPRSIECLMSNSNKSKESLKEIKKWYSI